MIKERVGILFDVHAPYHDKNSYEFAVNTLASLKPKLTKLIIGGDFIDCHKISFFKSDPNRESFRDEIIQARKLLIDLRKRFPKIKIDFINGNHETRVYRYVRDNAPELLWNNRIENLLHLDARNINYIDNIKLMNDGYEPYKLGKLYVLHGHEKKISYGAVNLARLMHIKTKANVIFGHYHKSDKYLTKKLDGTHEGCWAIGTLGKLSEPYQPISDWVNAFAYVDVFRDGFFEVHSKLIMEGRVVNA